MPRISGRANVRSRRTDSAATSAWSMSVLIVALSCQDDEYAS
jgi:hypothetical protein